MADIVQKRLEDFVPDLHELLSHGLFTQPEIKQVIEKRRKFEFEILSSDPNISLLSYKDYLKFEMELDKMIQSRLKNFKRNKFNNRIYNFNNNRLNKLNGSLKDLNGKDNENNRNKLKIYKLKINNKRYIHNIFRRCLNRFVNNIEMYKLYLSYCTKIKANKLFERVIIDSLSKNPNNESMWLILGSFLLNNKGLTRSKNVVQRALRILPESLDLILYLFKLEIKSLLIVSTNYNNSKTNKDNRNNTDSTSSISISSEDSFDNDTIDTLNRCFVIYKYGIDNLKNDNDLIVFYFSVLNILSKLRNKIFDNDFENTEFNTTLNNKESLSKQIMKLLDNANNLIKYKNIPIIILYNYQIHLMEHILIKSTSELELETGIDSNIIDIINDNKSNITSNNSNDNGLLVLYLQFLYNILSNKLQLDNNKHDNEELINRYLSDIEREYIVSKYCILENVYHLCLLGRIQNSLNRCKNTSYLISIKHLNYLYNMFKNYYNDLISKNNLIDLILKINIDNDTYKIYYYIKLLILLSNNNTSNIDNSNNKNSSSSTNSSNNNSSNTDTDNISYNSDPIKYDYNKLILNKINEISIKLSQIKSINNDELIYLILKLNIDFNLKLKILKNFNKIDKFNINYLFDCKLNESEIIELFLIIIKLDNNCDFTIFLDRFIGNYNINLNSIIDKLMIDNTNNLFFNNFIKYIIVRIDNHLNHLNCLYTINNTDNFINSLNSVVDLSKLNRLIKINTLDVSNKSLVDNLNVKLNLLGLNIYRN